MSEEWSGEKNAARGQNPNSSAGVFDEVPARKYDGMRLMFQLHLHWVVIYVDVLLHARCLP